ncbi:FKBP12-interacting protein of 37 kDa [Castilleja foliolosa]|uniref:FKBP12-interacting protein of 37 kDa n=1 Tax=Castilleja foliolosa TaxID=1961234 RepID=A0ABD3BFA1_9LAMI
MASHDHLDDEDDFGGDFAGGNAVRRSGNKRSFGDLDVEEDDIFGSKKANQN